MLGLGLGNPVFRRRGLILCLCGISLVVQVWYYQNRAAGKSRILFWKRTGTGGEGVDFWERDERLAIYRQLREWDRIPLFFVDPLVLLPLVSPVTRRWISRDPAVQDLFLNYDYMDLREPPLTLLAAIFANETAGLNRHKSYSGISLEESSVYITL
jgi:hypothetical protein